MQLRRTVTVLVLLAALGGCGDDPVGTRGTDATPTPGGASGAASGAPVAGSGAGLAPDDVDRWCGAITADQLAILTGFEIDEVGSWDTGVQACHAELPGVELDIHWGSEPTRKSLAQYVDGWARPPGVFDSTDIELPGGTPAVVATAPSPRSATAGTVVDGRLLQARVIVVGAKPSITVEDLARMTQSIIAVYTA